MKTRSRRNGELRTRISNSSLPSSSTTKTNRRITSPTANPKIHPNSFNNSENDYNDIYLDVKNPASYSSSVKAFVEQKTSISLHKRKIKNFKRRKIVIPGPYHSISCDLIDYSMYSSKNSSYKYILCCIDMFSRYAYAKPLKNKTAEAVSVQLDEILKSMQFIPKFFTSDKGNVLSFCLDDN